MISRWSRSRGTTRRPSWASSRPSGSSASACPPRRSGRGRRGAGCRHGGLGWTGSSRWRWWIGLNRLLSVACSLLLWAPSISRATCGSCSETGGLTRLLRVWMLGDLRRGCSVFAMVGAGSATRCLRGSPPVATSLRTTAAAPSACAWLDPPVDQRLFAASAAFFLSAFSFSRYRETLMLSTVHFSLYLLYSNDPSAPMTYQLVLGSGLESY